MGTVCELYKVTLNICVKTEHISPLTMVRRADAAPMWKR